MSWSAACRYCDFCEQVFKWPFAAFGGRLAWLRCNRREEKGTRRTQRTAEGTEARPTPRALTQARPSFQAIWSRKTLYEAWPSGLTSCFSAGRVSRAPIGASRHSFAGRALSGNSRTRIVFFVANGLKTKTHPRLKTPNQPEVPPQTLRFSASSAFLPLPFGCDAAALCNPWPKKPSVTRTNPNCGI